MEPQPLPSNEDVKEAMVPIDPVVRVALWAASGVPGVTPDPSGLPGGNLIVSLTNGLEFWALMAALAGLLVGAAAWALGSHSQNYHQSFVGRRTVLVSGLAALLIGAAPGIVNFFFSAGTSVQGH